MKSLNITMAISLQPTRPTSLRITYTVAPEAIGKANIIIHSVKHYNLELLSLISDQDHQDIINQINQIL